MNCFVIMPFGPEFDDVYQAIKHSVESASQAPDHRCFRLDESRPAGRITERLLAELRSASICVADITGTRPNVMWELGFAMALAKPTVIVTQDSDPLPFDIKDLQSIEYQRTRLGATLSAPLKRTIIDTLGHLSAAVDAKAAVPGPGPEVFGAVLAEMGHLKEMVVEAVRAMKQPEQVGKATVPDLAQLEGDWINHETGSHTYARLIGGELVAPYCYSGNDRLTGVYFAWRRLGDYWFARYKWLGVDLSGFTFLRLEAPDRMYGAWWSSEEADSRTETPPNRSGVPATWLRQITRGTPPWAEQFIADVERDGLAAVLARTR